MAADRRSGRVVEYDEELAEDAESEREEWEDGA
jgi:hypothetical protein